MKGNHACGIDMIDGYSIKLALIEEIILHLVNLSLSKSQYPQYWKVLKISPYYKKGDKQLTENYRPVSNLIFVGMICEKVIAEQVFYHFDQKNSGTKTIMGPAQTIAPPRFLSILQICGFRLQIMAS